MPDNPLETIKLGRRIFMKGAAAAAAATAAPQTALAVAQEIPAPAMTPPQIAELTSSLRAASTAFRVVMQLAREDESPLIDMHVLLSQDYSEHKGITKFDTASNFIGVSNAYLEQAAALEKGGMALENFTEEALKMILDFFTSWNTEGVKEGYITSDIVKTLFAAAQKARESGITSWSQLRKAEIQRILPYIDYTIRHRESDEFTLKAVANFVTRLDELGEEYAPISQHIRQNIEQWPKKIKRTSAREAAKKAKEEVGQQEERRAAWEAYEKKRTLKERARETKTIRLAHKNPSFRVALLPSQKNSHDTFFAITPRYNGGPQPPVGIDLARLLPETEPYKYGRLLFTAKRDATDKSRLILSAADPRLIHFFTQCALGYETLAARPAPVATTTAATPLPR